MMRSLLTYLLLFAVLLPSISPLGTIAYYQVNREYIAKVLCENRDKPQMHCDGKCYLAKRLKAQQDKQDKEATERVQQTASIQLFCENQLSFVFAEPSSPEHRPVFAYQASSYARPTLGLLKPPRLLLCA